MELLDRATRAEEVLSGISRRELVEQRTGKRVQRADRGMIEFGMQLAQISPGKIGLRAFVYNQASPEAKSFAGLDHFAFDPKFVVDAKFEPVAKIEGVDFQTSRG